MYGQYVENIGTLARGKRISSADFTKSWAASALINTTKYQKIGALQSKGRPATHEIVIENQAVETALNAEIGNIHPAMGSMSEDLYSALTTVIVPASTSAVIEDCEDAWNEDTVAEVTATASTTAAALAVGTNSAKFAIGAAFTTGIIGFEQISSTNLSKYTHIYAYVYSTVALDAGDVQLLLDNTAKCASPLETINLPAIPATTLTRVRLPLANPELDLAVISIGLKLTADKGAMDFHIDDVRAVKLSTVSTLVQGWRNGVDGYVILDNATALGANQGFDAVIRPLEY
jgi:hypothetical protein